MKFKAQQIADILEGDVVGNPEEEVSKLSKKKPAIGNKIKKANIVTFVNLVFGKLNISLCAKNKL